MKKKLLLMLFSVFFLCTLSFVSINAKENISVSPALSVLAMRTDMAKTALVGDNIGFTEEDFMRALNMSSIDSIVIESVPAESEGRLLLGSAAISAGKAVAGADLDLLTFVPASDDVRVGSFDFSLGTGYSIKCNLRFAEKTNYSPTVSMAAENALSISTHSAVSHMGKLDAYDPEGDTFVYEIVSYPENGSVVLLDRELGRYVYTPAGAFKGIDSFSYVARDIYGNYSAKATVSVNVRESRVSVTYGDISDCNVYNAAITMAENSIMSSTLIEGVNYFSPGQNVTRAEFLTYAMKAAGIKDAGDAEQTVFSDDEDIAKEYKGYVNAAYELGIINGTEIDGKTCFLPNSNITRAEAAVVLNSIISGNRAVDAPAVLPVFADGNSLPSWASSAIFSMNSMGVFSDIDGYASPDMPVTRGDAAEMLAAVINIFE